MSCRVLLILPLGYQIQISNKYSRKKPNRSRSRQASTSAPGDRDRGQCQRRSPLTAPVATKFRADRQGTDEGMSAAALLLRCVRVQVTMPTSDLLASVIPHLLPRSFSCYSALELALSSLCPVSLQHHRCVSSKVASPNSRRSIGCLCPSVFPQLNHHPKMSRSGASFQDHQTGAFSARVVRRYPPRLPLRNFQVI